MACHSRRSPSLRLATPPGPQASRRIWGSAWSRTDPCHPIAALICLPFRRLGRDRIRPSPRNGCGQAGGAPPAFAKVGRISRSLGTSWSSYTPRGSRPPKMCAPRRPTARPPHPWYRVSECEQNRESPGYRAQRPVFVPVGVLAVLSEATGQGSRRPTREGPTAGDTRSRDHLRMATDPVHDDARLETTEWTRLSPPHP